MKKAIVFVLIISILMQFGCGSLVCADANTSVSITAQGRTRIEFKNYTAGYRNSTGGDVLETGSGGSICIRPRDYAHYDINVEAAGNYKLTIATAYPGASNNKPITISSGNTVLGKCNFTNTGSWTVSGETLADEIYLDAGLQTLKFVSSESAYFYYFILEKIEIKLHDVASSGNTKIEFEDYSKGYNPENSDTSVLEEYSDEVLSCGKGIVMTNTGDYAMFKFNFMKEAVYRIKVGVACAEDVTDKNVTIKKGTEVLATAGLVNTDSVTELDFGEIFFSKGIEDITFESNANAYFDYVVIEYVRELFVIEAENFDNSKNATVFENAYLSFNTKNWVEYNVTVEKDGFYRIDMYSGISPDYGISQGIDRSEIAVSLDGSVVLNGVVYKTTAWKDFQCFTMGSVYMEAGDHVIKFEVTFGANYFDRFIVDYEGNSLDLKSVSANGTKIAENGNVFRGTDFVELEFSQALAKRSVTGANIYLSDGEKNIVADLTQDGKKIGIVLKETLDFNKEYTVYVKNVIEANEILSLDNASFAFTTYDFVNDGGEASVSDVEASIKYEKITVTGKMYSSKGVAISGRKAELYLSEGGVAVADSLSGIDGTFTIEYTLPDGTVEGNIMVFVGGEYVESAVSCALVYVSENTEKSIVAELKDAADTQDIEEASANVETVFSKYETELSISIETDMRMLTDGSKVFKAIANTDISSCSADDIINLYYTYIAVEAINQATSAAEIEAVLSDSEMCARLLIDKNKLASLEEERAELFDNLLNLEEISLSDDLIKTVNRELDSLVAKKNGKNGKKLSGDAEIAAYKGQGLDLPISFTESFSGMRKIVFEITAGDEAILNGATVIKNTYGDVESVFNSNKATIIYTPKSSDFVVSDIADLRVSLGDNLGERTILITGYIEYDKGLDYIIKEPIEEKLIKITVTENSLEPDRDDSYVSGGSFGSGGSSSGGGSGGGSVSSGGSGSGGGSGTVVPPAEYDKEEVKPTATFSDLKNFEWAEESIENLVKLNIISASDDNKFNPNNSTKREEIVKMIVLAFGVYDQNAKTDFSDVSKDAWFYSYVASAQKSGIIMGNDINKFMSGQSLTREDIAVMIWRALKQKGYTKAEKFETFADDNEVSDYAKEAVYSMRELGIINGMGDNTFAPKSFVTRAQAAKIIYGTVRMVMK